MNILSDVQSTFPTQLREYYKSMLKKEIKLFMLRSCQSDETTTQVFDLYIFDKKFDINDMSVTLELTREIMEYLHSKKWKTFLCYGDSCLAIFVKDPPVQVASQMLELKGTLSVADL